MKSKIVVVFLFVASLLKAGYFSTIGFGLLDEGESLHNAKRIISGLLPYKDFFAIFPPGDNYYFAATFKIFGESVVEPRLVSSLIFAFVPVFIFLLGKRFGNQLVAFLFAISVIFIDLNVERLYFFAPILGAIWLVVTNHKRMSHVFFSGLLLAISSTIRVDLPTTYALGLLAWVWFVSSKVESFWRFTYYFVLGYAVVIVPIAYILFATNSLIPFYEQAVIGALLVTKLHSLPFPAVGNLLPSSFSLNALYAIYTAWFGYGILIVYVVSAFLIRKQKVVIPFLVAGLLSLPYIFGRSDLGHFVKGGMPVFVLSILVATKNKLAERLMTMAAIALILVNLAQSIFWLRFNDTRLQTPKGELVINSSYKKGSIAPSAATLGSSIEFIMANSVNEESVLVLPYMAGLYFLSDRNAPTLHNNVLNGFIDESGEELFISQLEDQKVKVVVYDPANGPAMREPLLLQYNPLIHNYIMENFEVVNESPEGWLFMLKNE